MSDELKPRATIDTFGFAALLGKLIEAADELDDDTAYKAARAALIAHIDAWGDRQTGVPDGWKLVPMEPTEHMRQAAASFGHPDAGPSYPEGYSSQRGDEAVAAYRHMIAAAPTPKEDACGS